MRLEELGLSPGVMGVLKEDGITELYPPQVTSVPIALSGKNLVVAVPTASGKSLIGYLAATKHVLEKGGKVMYIVPLRALAAEKFEDLKKFEALGIKVSMSVGDYDEPDKHLRNADIIVATSEKADSLLRHRGEWLSSISLVVADEVHLINDPERGPTLEVTLAKLMRFGPKVQIIALSATVRNSLELAAWLHAEHVSSGWRPVKLKEGVFTDGVIRFTDNSKKKVPLEEDPVWSLVKDSLSSGGQCLVFVNTRRSTESMASKYAKLMGQLAVGAPEEGELKEIEGEGERTSIAATLRSCLKKGVAFHHAGLTHEQRRYVESNFKKGRIKIIIATPTLAAGINLPARRVIIRDVQRFEEGGYVPIPVMEIKQMCGRAGRPRYDTEGEAIVIAKNEDDASFIFDNYLLAEPEDVFSKLGQETVLRGHVLSSIATETARSWSSLMEFLSSTFFAHQSDISEIEDVARDIISFLHKEGMIVVDGDDYRATFFGQRVSDLYIDPLTAVKLRDSLRRYERGMGHFGFLHAVCATPDMSNIYARKNDLEWLEVLVSKRCKDLLCDIPEDDEYDFFLSEFKTAMTLEEWIEETDEEKILDVMGIGPGDLRNKVELAKWLLYSMRELAGIFNREAYPVLTDLMKRMEHGIRPELLDLVRLKGIGRVRARSLYNKGFTTVEAISKADVRALANVIGIGETLARNLKEQVGGPLETSKEGPMDISRVNDGNAEEGGQKKVHKQTSISDF
ncbi:MAG: DEAD/DEAH box helicase [Methanomassiliicoccales archaeon]|nr:MAG: DEAD/DEAH box helicase [Methanomassiliicoccales archaeon]